MNGDDSKKFKFRLIVINTITIKKYDYFIIEVKNPNVRTNNSEEKLY